jgi:hypothetical protein
MGFRPQTADLNMYTCSRLAGGRLRSGKMLKREARIVNYSEHCSEHPRRIGQLYIDSDLVNVNPAKRARSPVRGHRQGSPRTRLWPVTGTFRVLTRFGCIDERIFNARVRTKVRPYPESQATLPRQCLRAIGIKLHLRCDEVSARKTSEKSLRTRWQLSPRQQESNQTLLPPDATVCS